MSKPDNPEAFPRGGYTVEDAEGVMYTEHAKEGMSLRDWFAGQALIGIGAAAYSLTPADAANLSYKVADAMLAEREKVKP